MMMNNIYPAPFIFPESSLKTLAQELLTSVSIIAPKEEIDFDVIYNKRLRTTGGNCFYEEGSRKILWVELNARIRSLSDIKLILAHELAHVIEILEGRPPTHSKEFYNTSSLLHKELSLSSPCATRLHNIPELMALRRMVNSSR